MLFRTTLIIALSTPLLVNCSVVYEGLEGKTAKEEAKDAENPIASPRTASVLGNPVEEGEKDCVPKPAYGQVPDETEEDTDYPTEDTPPAGDTGQNQSDVPDEDKEEPSTDVPDEDTPSEDPGKDQPGEDQPGKDQPVEDC